MKLPEDFLWGGATADFQCEGGFGEGGRGLSTHDYETDGSLEHPRATTYKLPDGTYGESPSSFFFPGDIPDGAVPVILEDRYYPSHKAVDFYHHYKEDTPNEAGLKFYEDVINELEAHGMTPLITIHHDELPMYLAEKYDGWSSRHTIDCYVKYAKALFERFGKKCKYWLTFNEINAARGFVGCGTHKCDNQKHYNAIHNMFLASALAVKIGHEMMPGSMFGTMYASSELYPQHANPKTYSDAFRQDVRHYFLWTLWREAITRHTLRICLTAAGLLFTHRKATTKFYVKAL